MEFSSVRRAQSAPSVLISVNIPATESGDWKAALKSKLQTTLHDWEALAPAFEELIDAYVTSGPAEGKKHLNRLIRACMALGEPVLEEILAHEAILSMHIEGPVNARGWETLIAAIPAGFPLRQLKLSLMPLRPDEGALLLQALRRMPKLETLFLHMVGVEGAFSSERSDGTAFEALEAVHVLTSSEPELDVSQLLSEILEDCQLRCVSIQDYGALTADRHAILAEALERQRLLNDVTLTVEEPCSTPKQLECYMSFLCGQAPFTTLYLGGWELAARDFNRLLAALRNKPTLTSLSLCDFKFLKGTGSEPVQIASLADMRSLLELDLGWNSLEDDTMVPLLLALKEQQTSLRFLGLNGNPIGSKTIVATAALLNANRTLLELSFQPAVTADRADWDVEALETLAKAFEANTLLQWFRVRWSNIPAPYSDRLAKALVHNQTLSAMRSGMQVVTSSAGFRDFPYELVGRVYDQGLTRRDALRLASINKAAWNGRRLGAPGLGEIPAPSGE